jgi:hypothetical protein
VPLRGNNHGIVELDALNGSVQGRGGYADFGSWNIDRLVVKGIHFGLRAISFGEHTPWGGPHLVTSLEPRLASGSVSDSPMVG